MTVLECSSEVLETKLCTQVRSPFLLDLKRRRNSTFFSGAKRSKADFAAKQSSLRAVVVDLLMSVVPKVIEHLCQLAWHRRSLSFLLSIKSTSNEQSCVTLTQNGCV